MLFPPFGIFLGIPFAQQTLGPNKFLPICQRRHPVVEILREPSSLVSYPHIAHPDSPLTVVCRAVCLTLRRHVVFLGPGH